MDLADLPPAPLASAALGSCRRGPRSGGSSLPRVSGRVPKRPWLGGEGELCALHGWCFLKAWYGESRLKVEERMDGMSASGFEDWGCRVTLINSQNTGQVNNNELCNCHES